MLGQFSMSVVHFETPEKCYSKISQKLCQIPRKCFKFQWFLKMISCLQTTLNILEEIQMHHHVEKRPPQNLTMMIIQSKFQETFILYQLMICFCRTRALIFLKKSISMPRISSFHKPRISKRNDFLDKVFFSAIFVY